MNKKIIGSNVLLDFENLNVSKDLLLVELSNLFKESQDTCLKCNYSETNESIF